jgi:hypothetical protein
MELHNQTVYLNDQVYDIVRNYGRVVQITANHIEVQFPEIKVSYTSTGTQRGKTAVTLYWDKPYILSPDKDSDHWTEKKKKFDAILAIVNGNY